MKRCRGGKCYTVGKYVCRIFIVPRARSKARGPVIAALILMMRVVRGSVGVHTSRPSRLSPRRRIWWNAGVPFHVAGLAPSPPTH